MCAIYLQLKMDAEQIDSSFECENENQSDAVSIYIYRDFIITCSRWLLALCASHAGFQ